MLSTMFAAIFSKQDKDKGKFGLLDVLLALLLIGGVDLLYLFLPRGVVVVIWLFAAFWVIKRRLWGAIKKHRYLVSAGKAADRLKVILNMSDGEFESRFGPKDIPHTFHAEPTLQAEPPDASETGQSKSAPFMPFYACKQVMPEEKAQQLAQVWWEEPGADGLSGFQRIEELIQRINVERSTVHTTILTEHTDYLLLPKDEAVLIQLVEVAKANGLGAELSEDGDFVIQWGQDDSGREAGR